MDVRYRVGVALRSGVRGRRWSKKGERVNAKVDGGYRQFDSMPGCVREQINKWSRSWRGEVYMYLASYSTRTG